MIRLDLLSCLWLCLLLMACGDKRSSSNDQSSAKFNQYYIQGERLYLQHCSNCHQKNGKGLGLVYPPIDSSDYMDQNLTAVIKNGSQGEITVNGKIYNQKMPGVPSLTPLEIAEISTYIYNTWSHKAGLIDVKQTEKTLQQCTKEMKE